MILFLHRNLEKYRMSNIWSKVNRDIPEYLKRYRKIAVVGISSDPTRQSYKVSEYLLYQGYRIIPVNPKYDEIFGETCYKSLDDVPDKIDIVNIFRKPHTILPIIEEAIKQEVKVIWMQLGVINEEAAIKALEAGIDVVMDRCIRVEHAALR